MARSSTSAPFEGDPNCTRHAAFGVLILEEVLGLPIICCGDNESALFFAAAEATNGLGGTGFEESNTILLSNTGALGVTKLVTDTGRCEIRKSLSMHV